MKPLSEQLVGLVVAAMVVALLLAGVLVLNRHDTARETKLSQRERSAFVRDSLAAALAERDSMRIVWAQQKHERDSMRPIWEAQKLEREQNRRRWEAEKRAREAAREAEKNIEIILRPFDPNTADSTTLVHLGLRPWMARSVVHYREKGGRYRSADDFRKAYGMTDSLFQVLTPYINIADTATTLPRYPQKKDTLLNLNSADTTQLQLIRGIGSYTARKIVELRRQLGGFASVEQLRELPIHGVDSILPHFFVKEEEFRRIYINRQSVDAMARHKYISFEQAKAIREYRYRNGAIRSEEQLLSLKLNKRQVFTEQDIARLRPYLSFEE